MGSIAHAKKYGKNPKICYDPVTSMETRKGPEMDPHMQEVKRIADEAKRLAAVGACRYPHNIGAALDSLGYKRSDKRTKLFSEAARMLGGRGGKKAAAQRAEADVPKRDILMEGARLNEEALRPHEDLGG